MTATSPREQLGALPQQYEKLLAGQVTASEVGGNPEALQSVIAFVASNFVVGGASTEPETLPPARTGTRRGEARQRRRSEKKAPREVAPSEVLQLKDDESPLFAPADPKESGGGGPAH